MALGFSSAATIKAQEDFSFASLGVELERMGSKDVVNNTQNLRQHLEEFSSGRGCHWDDTVVNESDVGNLDAPRTRALFGKASFDSIRSCANNA